jgi:hypothetical protein
MFCSSLPDGSIKPLFNGSNGSNGPPAAGRMSTRAQGIDRCMRVLPHDNDTGAFFVTLLRKTAPIAFAPTEDAEAESQADAATAAATAVPAPPTPLLASGAAEAGADAGGGHAAVHATGLDRILRLETQDPNPETRNPKRRWHPAKEKEMPT